MKLIIIYLLLINALGLSLMLTDKYNSIKKHRRIPEATLLGIAAIGGSLGSLLGMYLVRHKTKHLKFCLGLPVLTVLQAVILAILFPYIRSLF